MTLAAHYIDHLRSPRTNAHALAEALAAAGLDLEARCFSAWSARNQLVDDISIASTPPSDPELGARWFDPCELTVMVNGGRAWLSQRPTARWQMRGFLEVSTRTPREVQVEPPYTALDPTRLTPPGDELARCTELTTGEATLYSWWFGKSLPHQYDWQGFAEDLPSALPGLDLTREWTSSRLDDEAARIVITPSSIEQEPGDDKLLIRGELTRDLAIGFRTSVLLQHGLYTAITSWGDLVEPVKVDMLDRSTF